MATVINNPPHTREDTGSGLGIILAVILVLALAVLLFIFGVPALRNAGVPSGGETNINVPDRINVDLNNGGAEGTPTQ